MSAARKQRLSVLLAAGLDALMLREPALDMGKTLALAAELRQQTAAFSAGLWIHAHADIAAAVQADGVHLPARQMQELPAMKRWLQTSSMLFSVSCHDQDELSMAAELGADFAFLSPVFPTQSHPGAPALGVQKWQAMADAAALPVVPLGGVSASNRQQLSAPTVAVMRSLWESPQAESDLQALQGQ